MDAIRALLTKRDTRAYDPKPVEDGVLESVLKAGRMAGSAKNSQVTRVVLVTEQATRDALAGCGDFTSWIGTLRWWPSSSSPPMAAGCSTSAAWRRT
jgi:nitroreductase